MGLRRLSEDDVPHLGSASLDSITWSIVSGFKALENDVVIRRNAIDMLRHAITLAATQEGGRGLLTTNQGKDID